LLGVTLPSTLESGQVFRLGVTLPSTLESG
jgi:hypothetical protein